MTRARRIRYAGAAEGHSKAAALLEKPGDVSIDFRGTERALVMSCPDGCGDVLTINLDRRSGKAWRREMRSDALTVYPSVWRDTGCGAHFIIWRDNILWCDWKEFPDPQDSELIDRVRAELGQRPADFSHYERLAEVLNENPWDVGWACRVLVRRGEVEERGLSEYRLRRLGHSSRADRSS